MKKCERCGAKPEGKYGLLDYCAQCSKDLCPKCMAKGCCGKIPADSGQAADDAASEDEAGA
jgi:hypothetical protein